MNSISFTANTRYTFSVPYKHAFRWIAMRTEGAPIPYFDRCIITSTEDHLGVLSVGEAYVVDVLLMSVYYCSDIFSINKIEYL